MTIAETAASRIRRGMAPALAVHITAREYGTSTRTVARELAARRRRRVRPGVQDAWWNR